ncbi:helix-loop-helix protein delilah [Zeugodacus cucurbitae]|uniref:helix-loop-helix protein delilah n=1 Tax=Zeugodacus cucurbitae TaxID=28588 RepID=UPI0023D911F5|nr:helix-loop-helix protein delilah [Zeugodacus cucurbitae]
MHDYTTLLGSSQRAVDEGKCSKTGSRKEKYALRERQKRRLGLASVVEMPKRSNHRDDMETTTGQQRTQQSSTASKSKAPPLSKYRRKTANARERTRMREINTAFENLRQCVPPSIAVDEAGPTNEKLTKITTLRLAMKYIDLLTDVLHNPDFKGELPLDFLCASEETAVINELTTAAPTLKVEAKSAVTSKSSKAANKATTAHKTKSAAPAKTPKRLGKRKKKDVKPATGTQPSKRNTKSAQCRTATQSSTASSSISSSSFVTCSGDSLSSHSSSFLDSITSPSYLTSFVPAMSELNSLTLESDGESLHLSDPCNSPLQDKYDRLFGTGALNTRTSAEQTILGDIDTPLELSLQFLGTTPGPLDFSLEQPPTTCISPLVALDSFNPFSDFLHDYPEQASLDLFLT